MQGAGGKGAVPGGLWDDGHLWQMRHTGRPRTVRHVGPALVAAVLVTTVGAAQTPTPESIKRQLIEIGFGNPYVSTAEIYDTLHAQAPKAGVEVTKDHVYGDHERHRLDVYRPADTRDADVLVYVHGGGYRSGDRDISEHLYANVGFYFARQGLVVVNATYRLAPEVTWPSGAEDMRGIVSWVQQHAREYGGNPDRVFMMGHSAGATHVATYAFDGRFHLPDGPGVSGVVLVSGRYTIKSDPDDVSLDGIRLYFGDESARYPSRSAVSHVANSSVPALLVIAEFDQRNLVETTGELFTALCDRDDGRCPRLLQLPYHNHMSVISHINSGEDILGHEVSRGHYSQAIVHNGLVFTAGQLPFDPRTGQVPSESVKDQTRQAIENVANVLAAVGASLNDVIKVTVFVSDIGLWGQVNEVYTDMFADHKPARSVVPTRDLHNDVKIEIEAIAAVPQ